MGHATERTTLRVYPHLLPTGMEEVATAMEPLFAEVEIRPPMALLTIEEAR